jgi:hypothetical protein
LNLFISVMAVALSSSQSIIPSTISDCHVLLKLIPSLVRNRMQSPVQAHALNSLHGTVHCVSLLETKHANFCLLISPRLSPYHFPQRKGEPLAILRMATPSPILPNSLTLTNSETSAYSRSPGELPRTISIPFPAKVPTP